MKNNKDIFKLAKLQSHHAISENREMGHFKLILAFSQLGIVVDNAEIVWHQDSEHSFEQPGPDLL
jgi:hypothetical protein